MKIFRELTYKKNESIDFTVKEDSVDKGGYVKLEELTLEESEAISELLTLLSNRNSEECIIEEVRVSKEGINYIQNPYKYDPIVINNLLLEEQEVVNAVKNITLR